MTCCFCGTSTGYLQPPCLTDGTCRDTGTSHVVTKKNETPRESNTKQRALPVSEGASAYWLLQAASKQPTLGSKANERDRDDPESSPSGLQPRLIEGRCVDEGIVKRRGFNRTAREERWDPVESENLQGTPWKLKEPRAMFAMRPMLVEKEAIFLPIIPETHGKPPKRKLYLLRGDVERPGATGGSISHLATVLL